MKFAVRYWSSMLPDFRLPNGEPRWVDYSLHPGTKLGLHNALLTLQDRHEVLDRYGALFECAVYIQEGGREEMLDQKTAERLFFLLPHGEVKWLDIRNFLLAPVAVTEAPIRKSVPPEPQLSLFDQQLSLFDYPRTTHTPYDDTPEPHHDFDEDA